MSCPTPSPRDVLRISIGDKNTTAPLLTALGLEAFLDLCFVVRTTDGSSTNLNLEQIAYLNQLAQQILDCIETLPQAVPNCD